EGTVFFADEPILRVTAPLPEAQLVESRLHNLLHFQTLVASNAARAVMAAPGKLLVDFGMRRAHGAEAALLAARASYLAGLAGSATVLANLHFGIPVYGTMAHSFVQAHDDEAEAFAHFAADDPEHAVLLLDTYDTEAAAAKVVALAREGVAVRGVRLDSGDLAEHARRVRRILDAGGLGEVTIFASGNLDEDALRDLIASGAPIDGFGLGTRLVTAADAPYLDCAYKLVEYAGRPRRKRSEGKASWPGRKQVWRRHGDDGRMREDVLALADDPQAGTALLVPVMRAGRRVGLSPSLAASRAHAAAELGRLPEVLRRLEPGAAYPVTVAPALAPWPRPWTGGELSPDRARRRLARGRAAARRARPWAHARARRQRRLRHGLVDRPVAAREPRLLSAGGEHARAPAALLRASFSRGRGGRD